MTSTQVSLLDVRKNPAKYLGGSGNVPVTITKRGKKVAVVIDPETAEQFWQWKEMMELKELYYQSKAKFENYGKTFLESEKLNPKEMSPDDLVESVADA